MLKQRRRLRLWYLGRKSGWALSSLTKMVGKLRSNVQALNQEIGACEMQKDKAYDDYQKKVKQFDTEQGILEGQRDKNSRVLSNLEGLLS